MYQSVFNTGKKIWNESRRGLKLRKSRKSLARSISHSLDTPVNYNSYNHMF